MVVESRTARHAAKGQDFLPELEALQECRPGACKLGIYVAWAERPGDPGSVGAPQVGGTDPLSRREALL